MPAAAAMISRPSKRTYHFVSRTSRYTFSIRPENCPTFSKTNIYVDFSLSSLHDPAFREFWKKRAALGYILLPFFFMSLLCIFYFVRVVPGPCANLSWFENHQKCLKVFRQCENSKLCNNAVHPSVSIVIISIQYQCIDLKAIDNDEWTRLARNLDKWDFFETFSTTVNSEHPTKKIP